jgi:hypothetical protein
MRSLEQHQQTFERTAMTPTNPARIFSRVTLALLRSPRMLHVTAAKR